MRLGPTITVTYHHLSLIDTSQTQTLLITEYLISSHLQGALDIDMGKQTRDVHGTHAANLEFGNSLLQFREASSVWSFKSRHRPETKTA